MKYQFSTPEIDYMRDWLLDCFDHDEQSIEDIQEADEQTIAKACHKYWHGGLDDLVPIMRMDLNLGTQ